jgi:hypothetical protein
MRGDRRRYLRGVAYGAATALVVAGCYRPPGGTTTTTRATTTTTRATTTTTHGGHEHETPDRLNHPPTNEQKAAALKWVDEVRAAFRQDGITVAKLQQMGYLNIGDGVHWIKPEYTRDDKFLDPHAVESYAVFLGQVSAAMFVYNPKGLETTLADVPDIAGNWTQWHGHQLPYRSNDPMNPDFFRLGGPYWRSDSPMIHVWMQPNQCGPWASAGVGEGSCIRELANY